MSPHHNHPLTPSPSPPPSAPRHITDTPASEREFLENLHELDHKVSFMKEQDFNECRAVFDVRDVVEKLKLKAVDKIRVFLLQKIFQFRRPMANYQMLQNQLLNYRYGSVVESCISLCVNTQTHIHTHSPPLSLSLSLSLSHQLLQRVPDGPQSRDSSTGEVRVHQHHGQDLLLLLQRLLL